MRLGSGATEGFAVGMLARVEFMKWASQRSDFMRPRCAALALRPCAPCVRSFCRLAPCRLLGFEVRVCMCKKHTRQKLLLFLLFSTTSARAPRTPPSATPDIWRMYASLLHGPGHWALGLFGKLTSLQLTTTATAATLYYITTLSSLFCTIHYLALHAGHAA